MFLLGCMTLEPYSCAAQTLLWLHRHGTPCHVIAVWYVKQQQRQQSLYLEPLGWVDDPFPPFSIVKVHPLWYI